MRPIFGSSPLVAACLLLVQHPQHAASFMPTNNIASSRQVTLSANNNLDDEVEGLDQARQHFEHLMDAHFSWEDAAVAQHVEWPHHKNEYTPTPLTESSRRRRLLEMELLEAMENSDEAIEELMSLWIVERGAEASEKLKAMETVCSAGLVQEEHMLRQLIEEYDVHWAEPVSRLAALLYFQGRSGESDHWCDVALAVKPWHFEAAHTQVLNALREEDLGRAIRCRRKGLPPLNPKNGNRARKAWVRQAVKDAKESLAKAEAVVKARKSSGGHPNQADQVWQ